eukprot:TRINITY_DN16846_c0_g2_i1.p1 TRINITY_DN16846_c0_g2~~TRINITY_DN16846_c0_g2_i1.p1  ORF type:complete len:273 (+),score=28.60 TRINITY_DN16846_c0_g2_i1:48-866(+)
MLPALLWRPLDWAVDLGHHVWHGSGVLDRNPDILYIQLESFRQSPKIQKLSNASLLPDVSQNASIKRIVCVSDTHERHRNVFVPSGSVLIHCGDMLTINRHFSPSYSMQKLDDFAEWIGALEFIDGKVVIAGNHDAVLEEIGADAARELFKRYDQSVSYLEDEGVNVGEGGLSIWGSPLSRGSSSNDAFQSTFDERLSKVPQGSLDILVTHGPLSAAKIAQLGPRIHVCGHIHNQYGARMCGDTLCVNAAIMDGRYQPTHGAVVIDMPLASK